MFGSDDTFWRDPSYRFANGILLEHTLPRKYRGWLSVLTGAIVLLYLAVAIAPYVQSRLRTGIVVPQTQVMDAPTKSIVIQTEKTVTVPSSTALPKLIPGIGGTEIPLDTSSEKGNGIFFIALAIWLTLKMLSFHSRSYYYYV
jgi:hypothetical protein